MPHFMVCDSTDLPVPFFVVKDAHVKNGPPLIFSTNSEKSLSDPEPVGGLLKTKKSSTTREKCATRNLRNLRSKYQQYLATLEKTFFGYFNTEIF